MDAFDEHERRMAEALIGTEGLALAAGVAEFLQAFIDGIPVGYSVRLDVDRTDTRDDFSLAVSTAAGEVDFIGWWREGRLELVPAARPYVV